MKINKVFSPDYISQSIKDVRHSAILSGVLISLCSINVMAAEPVVWVEEVRGGEVRFYDWGYVGPDGRRANEFSAVNGFNGAAQIQHVVTTGPDGLTPDDPILIKQDITTAPLYWDANMDSQVNFYDWGYTTVAGSTFSNMQIDSDGDYLIKRQDMSFNYYGQFDYIYEGTAADPSTLTAGTAEGTYVTNIGFQPYALSDATGWCGSVTASNPGALEAMAGQVTFDFGFEVYAPWHDKGADEIPDPGNGAFQIINDFQMRSYGSVEVDVTMAEGPKYFTADAVVNNTSPLSSTIQVDVNGNDVMVEAAVLNMDGTPALDANGIARTMMVPQKQVGGGGIDENYYNKVSFMGGGVIPNGIWIKVTDVASANAGTLTNEQIIEVLDADDGEDNTLWWVNGFGGYPFLLRADGIRVVDALDFSLYDDLCAIPGAVCDADGVFIGATGGAFDENNNLINLEGNIVQNLNVVPVPAAVWLFGSGLIGILAVARRRKK